VEYLANFICCFPNKIVPLASPEAVIEDFHPFLHDLGLPWTCGSLESVHYFCFIIVVPYLQKESIRITFSGGVRAGQASPRCGECRGKVEGQDTGNVPPKWD